MRAVFIFILLLAAVCGTIPVVAQLNEADTSAWQTEGNLSLKLNTGNVERLIITPELNVAHVSNAKTWGCSARERYTYGTFGNVISERDLLSRNFVYYRPEQRFYPYLMLWFQTHERQRLGFRYQAGAGVTWGTLRSKQQLLKISATITCEGNDYKEGNLTLMADTLVTGYQTFRITGRVFGSHVVVNDVMNGYYEALFQQALDNAGNWRVFAESGINIRVTKAFAMRTYMNYEYQTVHVRTERPADLILNVGASYRFLSKRS